MSDFSEKAKKALRDPTSVVKADVKLLSVDVGLKTAFACFDRDGRVVWVQSRHFSSPAVLRRGISSLLLEMPNFEAVVLEGSGNLARIWQKEMLQRGIATDVIQAEQWRGDFLYPRERRTGQTAKATANALSESVLKWSQWQGVVSKRDDAAEAILSGLWFLNHNGLITQLPEELRIRVNNNRAGEINKD